VIGIGDAAAALRFLARLLDGIGVMGWLASRPGKSQGQGFANRHQARRSSSSRGESMT